MKHYYPAYYKPFRCIAAACPDSCCQGWDVVIDKETETFYDTVPGGFGDRLREAIVTDSDGDRVFRLAQKKKCPFWGSDRLCEIYKALGEDRLCATCALFPRLSMEFADFTEHSLALACPEAARLILHTDHAYENFTQEAAASCEDYSAEDMILLLRSRRHTAALLTADKLLSQRLLDALRYNRAVQARLTDPTGAYPPYPEENACTDQSDTTDDALRKPLPDALAALFAQLEYIDEANRERFTRACRLAPDFTDGEREYTNLALYQLYRYYLGAVDTRDVLMPILYIILSLTVISGLTQNERLTLAEATQLYSKETEQSYENMEQLWETFTA